MSTKQDLDAALADFSSEIQLVVDAQSAAFARLEKLIADGNPPGDFQAEIDVLKSLKDKLEAAITTSNAEAPAPPVA